MAKISEIEEIIHSGRQNARSELQSHLDSGRSPVNLDELKPRIYGLVNVPTQEKQNMQEITAKNHETLPKASQEQNARHDHTVSPYMDDAASKMSVADKALADAEQSVNRLYSQSDPKQQKVLEEAQHKLHLSRNDLSSARRDLANARPEHNATLSKNGQSQFNAASRGDPRSMEVQISNQNAPAKKPPVKTISASPEWARDTPLERQRGEAMNQFEKAHDAKQAPEKSPQVDSEQVKDSKPEPALKPSPELGSGVDAQVHSDAKSKDHQASLQATKQSQAGKNAAGDQAKPDVTPAMREHYGQLSQQLDTMQSNQGQSQGMNQSDGMKP